MSGLFGNHIVGFPTSRYRDFPTFSKQGPGTNDFGKNNTYISQIGKMDTKQNRGYYAYLVLI